jgi:hypothetical protein
VRTVADTLTLQDLEIEIEIEITTQADVYRSENSVYACVVMSAHSMAC